MIKQPACERKCLLPLNSIAVGYRHAEERDGVPGAAQCPPPDMLAACDAGIHEHEYRRSSSQSCLLNAAPTAGIFGEWRDAGTVFPLVGTGAVLAMHPRKERSAIASRLAGHGLGLKSLWEIVDGLNEARLVPSDRLPAA